MGRVQCTRQKENVRARGNRCVYGLQQIFLTWRGAIL